jgi:poly-gamma-glutamate capsule biosynthesis protein CapA/YwtB (metallophosphatase superfamily)
MPAADVRFANLEGPLTERGKMELGERPRFAFPPARGPDIATRFDAVSLANNHALDQGAEGRDDTVRALGIPVAWEGHDAVLARRGHTITIVARDVLRSEPDEIVSAVKAARGVVIVSLHWGQEGSMLPNRAQRALAARLVDAGAWAVLGHGPHTIQGIERRGRAVIAYSLGNFALACHCSDVTDGMLLRFKIDQKGVRDVEPIPIVAGIESAPKLSNDPGLRQLISNLSADLSAADRRP